MDNKLREAERASNKNTFDIAASIKYVRMLAHSTHAHHIPSVLSKRPRNVVTAVLANVPEYIENITANLDYAGTIPSRDPKHFLSYATLGSVESLK